MEYKKYEYPSFNIYAVKTNHFKTCQMQIVFKNEAKKEDLLLQTFLADIMTDCSSKYKSRKEVVEKLEELYLANFYGVTNKVGNALLTSFVLSFLNPSFVSDEKYLEEVLSLPFEMIFHPFIEAEEFDIQNFHIVKNRIHDEIMGINENISSMALTKALSNLEESISKYSVMGTIPELEKISPKTLGEAYKKLMEQSTCDIYIVGNLNMDQVANIIFKYFKNSIIHTKEFPLYVDNPSSKKVRNAKENANFLETSLVNIYNIENLTKKEKVTAMYFYNYLLGGGGLNTKLYQLLREKNSLCYSVKSMYLKYDNLLVIQTAISKKDVRKANKLIKQAFKEMKAGKFSEKEIIAAKENFIFSLELSLDSPAGILNNYLFHILDDLPLIEERIDAIKDIKKEDIVAISQKIRPNLTFILEGSEENGSN